MTALLREQRALVDRVEAVLAVARSPVQRTDIERLAAGASQGASAGVARLVVATARVWALWLALAAVTLVGLGALGGWVLRGDLNGQISLKAGTEWCQDRSDGSRICWQPVYDQLPK